MSSKTAFEKVKDLINLNSYEIKVWTALLGRGIASAGELADISGVPRSRCYDVLETLEKKGFIFMKVGKPIKYMAIHPEEVLTTLQKEAKREEQRMLELFEEVKDTEVFKELQDMYHSGISYIDSTQITDSIIGKQNINLFLKDIFANADNLAIHTSKEGAKRKLKVLKKAAPKKATITMHVPEQIEVPFKNIRVNKRDVSLRMVQVDGDQLVLFTSPEEIDPELENAVWMKSKFTADTFKRLLE